MLFVLLSQLASAGEITGSASGFGEVRGLWYAGASGEQLQLVERFRPTFQARFGERVELVTTLEVGFQQGRWLQDELERTISESALLDPLSDSLPSPWEIAGCEWPEGPRNETLHIDGLQDYTRVDRLYADVYLKDTDIRVGRQAVQWGNALLIHPADPFPEVLFLEPWRPRAGVNAARVNFQLGDTESLTLLAGMDDVMLHGRAAGKLTTNVLATDLSLIGAWRGDSASGIVGLDVKGTAEVGFWFEGSWHMASTDSSWPPTRPGTFIEEGYEELAIGLDYSFPVFDQLVISGQYYRNGAGSPDLDKAGITSKFSSSIDLPTCSEVDLALFGDDETDPFAPYFSGRDYGMFATQVAVNDRWGGNAAVIQNLGDGTGVAVPTVSYKPAGWSEISLSAQVPYRAWGDGGELKPSADQTTLEVETVDGLDPIQVDMSGLVPDATITLWTRASF